MRQYPEYKYSKFKSLGDIPIDFNAISLKYLVAIKITDGPHETPVAVEEGIPFISAEAVQNYTINFDSKWGFISKKDHLKFSKKCKPINGDIFIVKSGATTGKVAYVNTDIEFNIWSPLALVRANEKKIYSRFLFYFIISQKFLEQVQFSWSYGTQQNIGMGVIQSLKIIVPPKSEQSQIVKYLDFKIDLIDGFIRNRQKQIDLLKEQLRKKIFTALTKGLSNKDFKPSDLPWFTEIPLNWEMYKFNAAIKLLHGFQFRDNHFKEQGVKVAKITQLKADGSLDLSEASLVDEKFLITLKKKIIKNGDILMALTGGTIGKIIQVENLEEEVLQNYRVGKFVPKDTRTLDKDFMFWVLSSEFTFAQILFLQRETGQPNIGIGDFSKMFFPMPNTLEEQREIASYIVEQKNETNSLISKYQKQIDLMQEYRTAIISQAVTGKIDVRDWQPKTKEIIS